MCVYCSDNVAHLKHAGDVHPPQQANPHVYVLQIKKLRTLCELLIGLPRPKLSQWQRKDRTVTNAHHNSNQSFNQHRCYALSTAKNNCFFPTSRSCR